MKRIRLLQHSTAAWMRAQTRRRKSFHLAQSSDKRNPSNSPAQRAWRESRSKDLPEAIDSRPEVSRRIPVDASSFRAIIHADKANYSNYYEVCLPLLKLGGLIVGDNVLWSGKVVDPKDADDHAIVAFDRLVQSDSRVENVRLTVRDGMMLAWKRG